MTMERKHILICMHSLHIGGAERSLLDLLRNLDYERVAVDLFLYRHEGEWMDQIPSSVWLLPEMPQYAALEMPIKEALQARQVGTVTGRLIGKALAAVYDKRHPAPDSAVALEYSHKYTLPFLPRIAPETEYDLAISFLTPHYFVKKKVRAKKKICWIHTDYSAVAVNARSERKMWGAFDGVISVSDKCTESFQKVFPDLPVPVTLIENILDPETVNEKAVADVTAEMPEEGVLRLLSIGRFCTAKNFDSVPEICAKMTRAGGRVKWYLIGYGDDTLIRQNVAKWNVGESVILLGRKENPYPYIKNCDVYVQPSRYEGKAVTVREAQMLHKPVIITDFATADSQLERDVDGIVVPLDADRCAAAIAEVLRNPERLSRVAEETTRRDYSNRKGLAALYQFLE